MQLCFGSYVIKDTTTNLYRQIRKCHETRNRIAMVFITYILIKKQKVENMKNKIWKTMTFKYYLNCLVLNNITGVNGIELLTNIYK